MSVVALLVMLTAGLLSLAVGIFVVFVVVIIVKSAVRSPWESMRGRRSSVLESRASSGRVRMAALERDTIEA